MPYIKEYSTLTPGEHRQLAYKRRYKQEVPDWDDSMVYLKQELQKQLPPNASVLDVGCGHGNFVIDEIGTSAFSKRIGIDMSKDATAGNTSMGEIVHSTATILPFDSNSFDVVTSLWVFEHVEHPQQLMSEIARVLKPGGLLAFVTPNKHSLLITIRRLLSDNLAKRLLKHLYNREDKDVYPVYYRMNTTAVLTQLSKTNNLDIITLKENSDPSYTSFNPLTYILSKWFSALPTSFSKPHIIGLLKKSK